jgi:SAM-dependent methyltransferase
MTKPFQEDKSNGYEEVAEDFMRRRNSTIGPAAVRAWSKTLPRGAPVLDLGCGHGVPVSEVLINDGFALYGVDASPTMIAAFQERFPNAYAECSSVEDSEFFDTTFDGVVAWGLLFLLSPDIQTVVIRKVARALNRGGKFVFTSPREAVAWIDVLTMRESISLGFQAYREILLAEGLVLTGELSDEGENHYYLVSKP